MACLEEFEGKLYRMPSGFPICASYEPHHRGRICCSCGKHIRNGAIRVGLRFGATRGRPYVITKWWHLSHFNRGRGLWTAARKETGYFLQEVHMLTPTLSSAHQSVVGLHLERYRSAIDDNNCGPTVFHLLPKFIHHMTRFELRKELEKREAVCVVGSRQEQCRALRRILTYSWNIGVQQEYCKKVVAAFVKVEARQLTLNIPTVIQGFICSFI